MSVNVCPKRSSFFDLQLKLSDYRRMVAGPVREPGVAARPYTGDKEAGREMHQLLYRYHPQARGQAQRPYAYSR